MTYTITPIGTIHSPYKTKEACPIQGAAAPDGRGRVEVFAPYEAGLETIETFTHLFLLYLFDRSGEILLSRPTFLDDRPHGVFASRHPCRPNGLGLSIVRLEAREGRFLEVSGIDVLDGTPLVDIKPYLPRFDFREHAGNGWAEGLDFRPKPSDRE